MRTFYHTRNLYSSAMVLALCLACLMPTGTTLYGEVANVAANQPENIPVISIGPIINSLYIAASNRNIQLSFCDQLTSELLLKYNCCILNRTRGYAIVREGLIEYVSSIEELEVPTNRIAAADYVVAAQFAEIAGTKSIEGQVFYESLASAKRNNSKITIPSLFEVPAQIADTIGSMLQLQQRDKTTNRTAAKSLEKNSWLVLPFDRMDIFSGTLPDDDMALFAEIGLQKNTNIKLVDRSALQKVLNEHVMPGMTTASRVSPFSIGRLVSADYLLIGTIAGVEENRIRLDMHVVDARTTIIRAAARATFASLAELQANITSLAEDLAADNLAPATFYPSSLDQRRREALFHSSNNFLRRVPNGGLVMTPILFSAIRNAEAAYLLDHDKPEDRYTQVQNLKEDLISIFTGVPQELPMARRAASFIDEALSSVEHSEATPYPLLARSEALAFVGETEKASQLINEQERLFPGKEKKRILIVKARCESARKNINEAVKLIQEAINLFGKDDRLVILQHLFDTQSNDWKNKQIRYIKMKDFVQTFRVLHSPQDVKDYFDLAFEIEGPAKTLDIMASDSSPRHLTGWSYAMLINQAKCYEALGRKENAIESCLRLQMSLKAYEDNSGKIAVQFRGYTNEVASIIKRINPGNNNPLPWKDAASVRPFAGNKKIYLVPVGDMSMEIVEKSADMLGKFFSTEVGVLNPTPIPVDAIRTEKEQEKKAFLLKPIPLLEGLVKNVSLPEDALFLIYLTNRCFENKKGFEHAGTSICSPEFIDDKFADNPVIVSCYASRSDNAYPGKIAGDITRRAIGIFHSLHKGKEKYTWGYRYSLCANFPCIYSSDSSSGNIYSCNFRGIPFLMCPACQEAYKKADFDKIHTDLMAYLKKAGAKIVRAETGT